MPVFKSKDALALMVLSQTLAVFDFCRLDTALCCSGRRDGFFSDVSEEANPIVLNLQGRNSQFVAAILKWTELRNIKLENLDLGATVHSTITHRDIETVIKVNRNDLSFFQMHNCSAKILNALLGCKSLQCVLLTYNPPSQEQAVIELSDLSLSNLKQADLTNMPDSFSTALLFNSPQVEYVTIAQRQDLPRNLEVSARFLASLPQILSPTCLKELRLDGLLHSDAHEQALRSKHLRPVLQVLRSLALTRHVFDDSTLNALLRHCSKTLLTELDLSGARSVTSYTATAITKHCPALTILDLSDCAKMTATGVLRLINGCKQLRRLDIAGLELVGRVELLMEIAKVHCPATHNLVSLRLTSRHVSLEEYYQELLGADSALRLSFRQEGDVAAYHQHLPCGAIVRDSSSATTTLCMLQEKHV